MALLNLVYHSCVHLTKMSKLGELLPIADFNQAGESPDAGAAAGDDAGEGDVENEEKGSKETISVIAAVTMAVLESLSTTVSPRVASFFSQAAAFLCYKESELSLKCSADHKSSVRCPF